MVRQVQGNCDTKPDTANPLTVTANPIRSDYEPPALTVELHPLNSVVMAAAVSESGNILRFPVDTTLDTKLTPRKGVGVNRQSFRISVDRLGMRGTVFWRRDAWWLRFTVGGKMRRLALKTTDARIARSKAIDLLTVAGRDGIAKLSAAAGCKDLTPTVGAIVDHYIAVTQCATAHRNALCLLRVVAYGKGMAVDGRVMAAAVRERARAVRASELTGELAANYQANHDVAIYTKGTTLAGAKAVFAHGRDWVGFPLPDLTSFFKISKQAVQKYSANSFLHIDRAVLAAMEQDSRLDPMIRKAFICCRYLGMTPKEVSFARKSWIEDRGNGPTICLRERPEEGLTLKTGAIRERDIVLADWMAAELMAASPSESEHFIALPTANLRFQWMLRVFNLWVRRYIPNRKGAAYELRKMAGSDWLEATGQISQVQYLLGHSTPTTTARYYATWARAVTVPSVFQEKPQQ
jgi:integrase